VARPEAGDRLRRLLAMLPWLAERGRVPIKEVADRFDMRPNEVVAELELAACCGLPPYTPDQLIELVVTDDYVEANLGGRLSRPLRFSPAEGFTVAASARAILAVPGADPDGALARALAKLEAALGQRQAGQAAAGDEDVQLSRHLPATAFSQPGSTGRSSKAGCCARRSASRPRARCWRAPTRGSPARTRCSRCLPRDRRCCSRRCRS